MTGLPVDYNKRPWRDKYLFDETSVLKYWFIMGTYPDGTVGICDGDEDIFSYVPLEVAQEIVKARKEFLEVIEKHFALSQSGRRGNDVQDR